MTWASFILYVVLATVIYYTCTILYFKSLKTRKKKEMENTPLVKSQNLGLEENLTIKNHY